MSGRPRKLKEIRIACFENTLAEFCESYDMTLDEQIQIYVKEGDCSVLKLYALSNNPRGEYVSFEHRTYLHECETLALYKDEVRVSARSLPATQQTMSVSKVHRVFSLYRHLPVVFEDITCSACDRATRECLPVKS